MPDVINSPLNLNTAKSQRLETVYVDVNGRWFRGIEDIGFLTGAVTDDTALEINDPSQSFLHFRFKSTSTSGDERGMYMKLILNGIGQFGDGIRTVAMAGASAATVANLVGIHATAAIAADNCDGISGQAAGGRFTLEIEEATDTAEGTLSSVIFDSFIGASITRRGDESFMRYADIGAVKMPQWFNVNGMTAGSSNACETDSGAVGTIKGYLRGIWTDGVQVYIVVYSDHS